MTESIIEKIENKKLEKVNERKTEINLHNVVKLYMELYDQDIPAERIVDEEKQKGRILILNDVQNAILKIKDSNQPEWKRELKSTITFFLDMKDLALQFYEKQPYFYDVNKLWWLWNKKTFCWIRVDETDLLNSLDEILENGNIVTTKLNVKAEILEAMKRVGRKKKPEPIKGTWIQFNKKIYDVQTGEEFESSPAYFATNPIPWDLGDTDETPVIDSIFKEWVEERYVPNLYEIIAFCMIPSYPIQRLFCLNGSGSNGKSCYLSFIVEFLGKVNCCSTSLDMLTSNPRFETANLYKKLFCQMGETNVNALTKSETLKKLTGGKDLIRFEFKGKDLFEEINYAKIIIATNSLPMTMDKTEGFYRRWFIIDFPNQFTEKRDVLADIPFFEYNNLARKLLKILKRILETRSFTNDGSIEDRMKRYEELSNPLMRFIKEQCIIGLNEKVLFSSFTDQFNTWCFDHKYRQLSVKELTNGLTREGYDRKNINIKKNDKHTNAKYILGLSWKDKNMDQDEEEFDQPASKIKEIVAQNLDEFS